MTTVIRAGAPTLEVIKQDDGHDFAVWVDLTDDVQITMALDYDIVEQIILTDLRDTYADPDYPDTVRNAIAILIKEVWTCDEESAAKKLAAFDRALANNRAKE